MEPVQNLKRFVAVLIILILPVVLIFAWFRNYSPNAMHEHGGGGKEREAAQGEPGAMDHDATKQPAGHSHGAGGTH